MVGYQLAIRYRTAAPRGWAWRDYTSQTVYLSRTQAFEALRWLGRPARGEHNYIRKLSIIGGTR